MVSEWSGTTFNGDVDGGEGKGRVQFTCDFWVGQGGVILEWHKH